MSDNELRLAVLDELAWEPSVDAANIGVSERAAWSAPGVYKVEDDITVAP